MGSTSRSITHSIITVGNFCNICIVFVLLLSFVSFEKCVMDVSLMLSFITMAYFK
jgi:hypothetical protein